jgi:hypothetical protein
MGSFVTAKDWRTGMRDALLSIWPANGSIGSILDLGCRDCWHTAGLPGVTRHVGVEVWPEALERGIRKAKAGGIPNFEPVLAEGLGYLEGCPDGSFAGVLAIDLLEHFPQDKSVALLNEMERVASKLAVVWTTMGYIPQAPFDADGSPQPYEQHLWGPVPGLFTERGWSVNTYPEWHETRGGAILAWQSK